MTKAEIIEETAAFYTSGNRSINSKHECLYNGPDGKRCAFSRCAKEDYIELLSEGTNIQEKHLELLKDEYKGHHLSFWEDIQNFHDRSMFWDEGGLTDKGSEYKDKLLNLYKN